MQPQDQHPHELDARPQSRREWSGWLRSIVLPLALVVAIVGALLVFEGRRGGSDDASGLGTVELPAERNSTQRSPSASNGRAAPDFLLTGLNGESLRLSDLQGRPVLVNFWASWCTSCREEMPDLIDAYDQHQASGLVVIGVNLRESQERAAAFVRDFGMNFPVLLDRSGDVASTWRIGGPNQGLPSSYFIDSRGVVQKVVFGTVTSASLREGMALILSEAR